MERVNTINPNSMCTMVDVSNDCCYNLRNGDGDSMTLAQRKCNICKGILQSFEQVICGWCKLEQEASAQHKPRR